MDRQLARVGLAGDPRIDYFPAVSPPDQGIFASRGAHGCFQSHLGVIEQAAAEGQSVLVFEDDCDFRVAQVLEYEMPECDVFYGGYIASDPDDLHSSDIIGSHFMGFSAGAAMLSASYLRSFLMADFVADPATRAPQALVPRPGIDGAHVWFRRTFPHLVTVFADLSYQRPSRTDIGEQPWFDRVPVFRETASFVRKFRKPDSKGYVFD